ncbi:glycosyltransferase [Roseovarius sp. CAU 1744]|uniref:glycosyltransferase n=1 Tax=Roseovarius sp. CAU 1744 TaxID=3140368 RepID=UPI00325BB59D
MGISELRQLDTQSLKVAGPRNSLESDLVSAGAITQSDAALAQLVARHCDTSLNRILRAEGLASENDLLDIHAKRIASQRLDARQLNETTPRNTEMDAKSLLKHGIMPFSDKRGRAAVAVSDPDAFRALTPDLPVEVASAKLFVGPRDAIQDTVARRNRETLTQAAQARVPAIESCRSWGNTFGKRLTATLAFLTALAGVTLAFPTAVFGGFVLWAVFTLVVAAALKTSAFVASVTNRDAPEEVNKPNQRLPKVSILVPLFRETEIAHALIARLTRLTYPKCLLDVILVMEEEDETTRKTLAGIDLPPWIRPVIVPDGAPRTKPRAMNYALDFCEGDIIGIFDAEDAPDPDQITIVARRFQTAPPDVVCLQGILDYYNPRQNWLARCFTIEYATWFRLMLPGLARLGFAIPLGGTTLYFRRDVLEELGGWDAHNVTEDADLGFRLARHGYRTEMIDTVTEEEANCRPWPWIKQRSRWLKGYMTTYLVHMRRPGLLYRQLGAWKFLGFQAHFLTALSQFILAPFLWSFWLILLGYGHPLESVVPRSALMALGSMFLIVEVLNIAIHVTAVSGRGHKHLMAWAPTMHFYSPLGAIAAYKALYELVLKPFFWDKTAHGLSLAAIRPPPSDDRVDFAGIELEPRHERF